jgi:hypothetical protein
VRDEVKFVDTQYDYTSIDSRALMQGHYAYQKASEARENNAQAIERKIAAYKNSICRNQMK